MTHAVCINCGAMKWGAFTACTECGGRPTTSSQLKESLAVTDHYLDDDKLKALSERIRKASTRTPSSDKDEAT